MQLAGVPPAAGVKMPAITPLHCAGVMQALVPTAPGTHALPAAVQVVCVTQVGGLPLYQMPVCGVVPVVAVHCAWVTQYFVVPPSHALPAALQEA